MGQALVVSWYHLRKRNGNDYYQLNTAVLSFHTSGFFFILFLCYRFLFLFFASLLLVCLPICFLFFRMFVFFTFYFSLFFI